MHISVNFKVLITDFLGVTDINVIIKEQIWLPNNEYLTD